MWINKEKYDKLQDRIKKYEDEEYYDSKMRYYNTSCMYKTTFERIKSKLEYDLDNNVIKNYTYDNTYLEIGFANSYSYRIELHYNSSVSINNTLVIALSNDDAKICLICV